MIGDPTLTLLFLAHFFVTLDLPGFISEMGEAKIAVIFILLCSIVLTTFERVFLYRAGPRC